MADSYQMFINGEWVNSSDGGTRDVSTRRPGGVLASVQEGTAEDANRAVAAAKKAFETWSDSTPEGPAARPAEARRPRSRSTARRSSSSRPRTSASRTP